MLMVLRGVLKKKKTMNSKRKTHHFTKSLKLKIEWSFFLQKMIPMAIGVLGHGVQR